MVPALTINLPARSNPGLVRTPFHCRHRECPDQQLSVSAFVCSSIRWSGSVSQTLTAAAVAERLEWTFLLPPPPQPLQASVSRRPLGRPVGRSTDQPTANNRLLAHLRGSSFVRLLAYLTLDRPSWLPLLQRSIITRHWLGARTPNRIRRRKTTSTRITVTIATSIDVSEDARCYHHCGPYS